MGKIQVSVKWSGQKYDVPMDLQEPALVFKNQIYSLTNVPPERQKIMVKGGLLKDDADLNAFQFKEGQSLLMMGTAGELPKEPGNLDKRKFLEDMTQAEAAAAVKEPVGLVNLGNTCYMNATLQCLVRMEELHAALQAFDGTYAGPPNEKITLGMRDLFKSIKASGQSIDPTIFLVLLRQVFPQFAQQTNGRFAQQDAEECWSQLVSAINDTLPVNKTAETDKFVQKYMAGELLVSMKSEEAAEEKESISMDPFIKLECQITSEVNYLSQGMKLAMKEQLEKRSPSLGRDAVYTKTKSIARLPKYLTVHMNRMFWRDDTKKKAKIMRRVQFPFDLDVNELCSPELKEKLQPFRELWRLQEDERERHRREKKKQLKLTGGAAAPAPAAPAATAAPADAGSSAMEGVEDGKAPSKADWTSKLDATILNDEGNSPLGMYDLYAVLTHTGRSADSGHYMAWTKNEKGVWQKYDDDKVTDVKEEEVQQLDGGGDRAMAYLLLYRSKHLD